MPDYNFYVYITTNISRSVLYIGVTNNLERRLMEHKANVELKNTFTGKYHCFYLVYYEHHTYINNAIEREKEIKKWRREKKEQLINEFNPNWKFLNEEVGG